jgi:hypothetical protein
VLLAAPLSLPPQNTRRRCTSPFLCSFFLVYSRHILFCFRGSQVIGVCITLTLCVDLFFVCFFLCVCVCLLACACGCECDEMEMVGSVASFLAPERSRVFFWGGGLWSWFSVFLYSGYAQEGQILSCINSCVRSRFLFCF